MQEYLDSEDLKRQWPRVGEYIEFIKESVIDVPKYDIDVKCTLTLFDPDQDLHAMEFNDVLQK